MFIAGDTLRPNGARVGILIGGGRQRVLTRDSHGPVSWSRDGELAAYPCFIRGGSPQLCTYDLRRSQQRVYAFPNIGDVMSPALSPDGTRVAMIAALGLSNERGTNLVIVNLADRQTMIMTNDSRQRDSPAWSPSGDVIAYATPSSIVLHVLRTGQEVNLVNGVSAGSLQWVSTPRRQLGQS